MKTELINFELWYSYDDEHDIEKINNLRISLVLKDIERAVKIRQVDTIVGLLLIDGFLYSTTIYESLAVIENEAKKLGIKNLYLLPGMCGLEKYQEEIDKRNLSYKIITGYDFAAKQMYLSYKNQPNIKWQSDTDKFLFLGGVPSRANRIGLLYRYYKENMLDNCEWTFFPPWTEKDKQWCRNYLNSCTDQEYNEFIKFADRAIDSKYANSKCYSTFSGKEIADTNILQTEWIQDPSYIDPNIYKTTSLSIITKYEYDNATSHSFLGEKTWRAIINNHPFILADNKPAERFDYMKSLGINTFDNFTINNYGYIIDEEERLDSVVENTKYFMSLIDTHKDEIDTAIKHNYNIFKKVCENNKEIEMLLKHYFNASKESMKILKVKGYDKFIRVPK